MRKAPWTAAGLALLILSGSLNAASALAAEPTETCNESGEVLAELVAIPGKQIPQRLLADAQGIAVIPNMIKIGLVAGVRRGHGIVMVRDPQGKWSLPQFVTLTGGSVGWQAGIQGTDVVLVFRTRKGVDGLMRGKCTIGADASATAGPVGRTAAAATDAQLKAEILSYSRSRGLFLGVSLDGSVIEIDQTAALAFYGPANEPAPQRVPEAAVKLHNYVEELTQPPGEAVIVPGGVVAVNPAAVNPAAVNQFGANQPQTIAPAQPSPRAANAPVVVERPILNPAPAGPAAPPISATRLEALRVALNQNAGALHALLNPEWRQYLALPRELIDAKSHPTADSMLALELRFEQIESSPKYHDLAERSEFQQTRELLHEYRLALSSSATTLQLPPPPNR